MTVPRPSLDTTVEPWVGRFPGLGEVRVHADGTVATSPVAAAEGDEPDELRERALRWGWGDILACRRRGLEMLNGVAATPPPYDAAVLLAGDGRAASSWLDALIRADWRFLSDRPSPAVVAEGGVTVHPRSGPLLAARQDVPGQPLARHDTDSAVVEPPRHTDSLALRGVLVLDRERVNLPPTDQVRGAERLTVALGLLGGGVLGSDVWSPATRFAAARAVAGLPMLRVRCPRGRPEQEQVAGVLAWVDGLGGRA